MKEFFNKLNKQVLCLIAGVVAILTFVVGILTVCENKSAGVGELLNSFIAVFAFALLAFYIWKDKKDKGTLLILILIGSAVLVSFGNSIGLFIDAGEYGKQSSSFTGVELTKWQTMVASVVFMGLSTLALFGGVVSHVLIKFTDKLPADKVTFVGTISYLASIVFGFVAFILMLTIAGDYQGNQFAITVMKTVSGMVEAFLLACLLNQGM